MKGSVLRLALALVLAFPIGWLLGVFDAFWRMLNTPVDQALLSATSLPFGTVDGERVDDPVALLMLIAGFMIAAAGVWGGPAALRAWRRRYAAA